MSGFISPHRLKIFIIHSGRLYRCRKTYLPSDLSRNVCTTSQNRTKLTLLLTRSSTSSTSSLSLLPSLSSTVTSSSGYCTFLVNSNSNNNVGYPRSLFSICGCRQYSKTYDTFEDQPKSWLYVSGSAAGAYGAQVNLDLDLENRLSSQEWLNTMRTNLEHRQIQFDLDSLVSDFEELTNLTHEKCDVEKSRDEMWEEIANRKTSGEASDKEKTKELSYVLNEGKASYKKMLNDFWSAEERVMMNTLRLPNDLHPTTPLQESIVVREQSGEELSACGLNHVEIGKKYDLIKFSTVGPQAYYLKGQVAHAARRLSDLACDYFQDLNYRLMSGPEFFKTPIMESCCQDVNDTDEVLTMRHSSKDVEPLNHLAGVSLMTFAGYLAKVCIGDPNIKMFSIGPRYRPASALGLYGASQTTQGAIFCGASKDDLESCFDETVNTVWNFLTAFGFPIRLIHCCASSLRQEEKRRSQIEIWAPSLNNFIRIGSVSDHGDFISRRQMSLHNHNHADYRSAQQLQMVSGTAINLTTLLAVWMEHSHSHLTSEQFSLSDLPMLSNGGVKKTTTS